ncbi:MAG: preprotein translocase subunit YajC [Actinomycetia bacterium]|nr:preprotein translocase subunit YajC [Actinomycetes bacterium]
MLAILVGMTVFTFYQNSQAQKKRQKLQAELKRGDRVVTVGGIVGRVSRVKDNRVWVQIADGVEVEMVKSGIGSRLEN